MKPIQLNKLTMYNELAMRANLNYSRLETAKYWPETIFEMDQHAWPADWEGRTMLALTMSYPADLGPAMAPTSGNGCSGSGLVR